MVLRWIPLSDSNRHTNEKENWEWISPEQSEGEKKQHTLSRVKEVVEEVMETKQTPRFRLN